MARTFFIVYHDDDCPPEKVQDVREQLELALRGEQQIVIVPDSILVEQVTLDSVEAWES